MLVTLPDQDQELPPTQVTPSVYRWTDVPFGDYSVGSRAAGMSPGMTGVLVTRVGTGPVQNPGVRLEATTPDVEYRSFYFRMAGTPENG